MQLLQGHIEAELQRRTCVSQLLLKWEKKDSTREEPERARTVQPDSYCDEWGCLNKSEQGGLCATCRATKQEKRNRLPQLGTESASAHFFHNKARVLNQGRLTYSKTASRLFANTTAQRGGKGADKHQQAFTQPHSGTHKGINRKERRRREREEDRAGTPVATRRTTASSRNALGAFITRSHFHKTKTHRSQHSNNNRVKGIQAYEKSTRQEPTTNMKRT